MMNNKDYQSLYIVIHDMVFIWKTKCFDPKVYNKNALIYMYIPTIKCHTYTHVH